MPHSPEIVVSREGEYIVARCLVELDSGQWFVCAYKILVPDISASTGARFPDAAEMRFPSYAAALAAAKKNGWNVDPNGDIARKWHDGAAHGWQVYRKKFGHVTTWEAGSPDTADMEFPSYAAALAAQKTYGYNVNQNGDIARHYPGYGWIVYEKATGDTLSFRSKFDLGRALSSAVSSVLDVAKKVLKNPLLSSIIGAPLGIPPGAISSAVSAIDATHFTHLATVAHEQGKDALASECLDKARKINSVLKSAHLNPAKRPTTYQLTLQPV